MLKIGIPIQDNDIDKIISIATLEHFSIIDLKFLLKDFYRILKKDGILEIGVPSLKKIIDYYSKNGCDDYVIRYLHGGQKDVYDIHLNILDFSRFKAELNIAGFSSVSQCDYDFPMHDKKFMMKIIAKK